jgi:hypothetical protein
VVIDSGGAWMMLQACEGGGGADVRSLLLVSGGRRSCVAVVAGLSRRVLSCGLAWSGGHRRCCGSSVLVVLLSLPAV